MGKVPRDLWLKIAVEKRSEFFKKWNQFRKSEEGLELSIDEGFERIGQSFSDLKSVSLPAGIQFIDFFDEDFPYILRELPQPPLGLFVKGYLGDDPLRAIVGARRPTPYAIRMTRTVSKKWVEEGYTIVSGGAAGIDGHAHEAALEAGGKTIVVLGGGHLKLYPPQHDRLFEQVVKAGGALISEYPPWAEPRPYTFPERNRIIAALGEILFLAQAHEKSGSLLTAKTALDLGREIFVLKPILGDPNFAGSAELIDNGAIAV